MTFDEVPPLTRSSNYQVNVSWSFLLDFLKTHTEDYGLNLNPDFQRGHVWTPEQQTAYVEYALRDGAITGRDLYFNCPNWQRGGTEGPYVIVDGLQRMTAVTKFLRNELRAYGLLHREFKGRLTLCGPQFIWHVNDLKTRAEVLRWYLEFNSGGTPHSQQELERVRKLLVEENR